MPKGLKFLFKVWWSLMFLSIGLAIACNMIDRSARDLRDTVRMEQYGGVETYYLEITPSSCRLPRRVVM